MKANWNEVERFRFKQENHPMSSKPGDRFGAFWLRIENTRYVLRVIVDDGEESGWEHASVCALEKHRGSPREQTPTWEQMVIAKELFWEPEETVVQYHPARSQYVNNHPNVLHLWRPKTQQIGEILLPPKDCV